MGRKKEKQKRKVRRFMTKTEFKYTLGRLQRVDTQILEQKVVRSVEAEGHISHFPERRRLWEHLKSAGTLQILLVFLVKSFTDKLTECRTGSEKFARFLISWHELCGTVGCETLQTPKSADIWSRLVGSYSDTVSAMDRSGVVFAIGAAVYAHMCEQMKMLQDGWRTAQRHAVEDTDALEPDDDSSLYRLFGFALFVSIRFRKRVKYGKLQKHYTVERKRVFTTQLKVLESLLETDKTVLPAVIKYQDRGKMLFPHRDLLPFCRNCSRAIKEKLNLQQYRLLGRTIISSVKRHVLGNERLQQEFAVLCGYLRKDHVSKELASKLYQEIVSRVINTMANSFFQAQNTLELISKNKGVDAHVALRDKLKVFASEVSSEL